MAEMVQRVARELFRQARGPGLEPLGDAWKDYENDSRAIIRLMREPTEVMDSVGYTRIDMHSDSAGPFKECATVAWQSMIDAALSESATDT